MFWASLFVPGVDIHARAINDPMKIACAQALAELPEKMFQMKLPWPMAAN